MSSALPALLQGSSLQGSSRAAVEVSSGEGRRAQAKAGAAKVGAGHRSHATKSGGAAKAEESTAEEWRPTSLINAAFPVPYNIQRKTSIEP